MNKLPRGYKEIRVCSKCGKEIKSKTRKCPYCNGEVIPKVVKK